MCPLPFSNPPFFKKTYLNQYSQAKESLYVIKNPIKQVFQRKKQIENLIYVHLENENFRGTGIPKIPLGREIPKAQKIPKSWEFPGNSCTGNSREGKV